jgi:hypothetical protein
MIKQIISKIVLIVQKILIAVCLVCVYFLGFGITLLFSLIFKRGIVTEESTQKHTFWSEAKGYEDGINDAIRQS